MNIKKKFMILLAVGVMAFSASPFVLAATPEPADNIQAQTQQVDGQTQDTQVPPAVTTQQTDTTQMSNSKYLTKGGATFWFIFTIVLNAVLSFWIGNRFYRLAKKDNHVSGEIRALRKDVEEKFVKSVGGFSEKEIDISNLNESLAIDEDGIKPVEKQPVLREISKEEEDRFKKWEAAQAKAKSEVRRKSVVKEELDEELESVKKIRRKNYQPKREELDVFDEEDDETEDLGETKQINIKGAKNKAKELLGDIFPFKED